jgi:hypothetical protein
MACDRLRDFWHNEDGATFLEFTIAGLFLFVFIFGAVEFSYIFYQWNLATKATQLGARLAAVSDPVASNINAITGLSNSIVPGAQMPAFNCTCTSASCTGTVPSGAPACVLGTAGTAALNAIVYGRSGATATSCTDGGPNMGMCDVFGPRLTPNNVRISYSNSGGATGMGYAGRPTGPVATITVELINMNYTYILLNGLFGLNTVTMPSFKTTITSEDLRKSAP